MKSRMKDTLLLIGDAHSDRGELHAIFESDYYLLEAETTAQGVLLLRQNSQYIAAVLADVPLTEEAGIRELVEASNPHTESEIPVILLVTPSEMGQQEERAFLLGAADVEKKPYAKLSIQRRVQVLVDLYMHRWHLEKMVEDQNKTLRNTYQTILDTMSSIIEHRSVESGNHVLRIRGFARILLHEVARCYPEYGLTEASIETITAATALHDIGKIVIPDAILNKPGPLTEAEFEIMKKHTTLGSEFIAELNGAGEAIYLHYAYNICLYHHERWDGRGYPKGLKGEEIPICAQVAGITDAFDALTTPRVYKPAIPYEMAFNMILNGECGAFSPHLLECFKRSYPKLIQLASKYADGRNPKADDIRVPLPRPEEMNYALDAAQVSQLKYQALLHHMNDAVIEIDLNNGLYHVVHNPGPNFLQLLDETKVGAGFRWQIVAGVHPDDAKTMEQTQKRVVRKLFENNQRKCTVNWRIFNPYNNAYDPYEITMVRVNTNNPAQRMILAVFHNLRTGPRSIPVEPEQIWNVPEVFHLMNTVLRCSQEQDMTIIAGSNTLMYLTGYTPGEITEKFGNALLPMVHPHDRGILQTMVRAGQESGRVQERQFRICHKTGTDIWVLGRCRNCPAQDDTQCVVIALTDVTAVRDTWQEPPIEVILNQVIIEQFKNVALEWDLETDAVFMSEQWEERFGFAIPAENFTQTLSDSSRIHPDDLPQLQTVIQRLREKETKEFADLRIADREGRYSWSRIRAVSLAEGQEKPVKVVAVVYNINDLKQDAMALKQQAERDTLTGLYNKVSTQQAAISYLDNRSKDALAALLILDVDNFKMVNDMLGHLYGDAILAQIGANLRNLFRSRDVIGRIGGDEFAVLLKDLPNIEIVEDRCELLVSTFREQLNKLMPDLPVSISVGCALAPAHGGTWSELFFHADEALYHAKDKGKCQYKIYSPQDTYHTAVKTAGRTQIDSDQQPILNEDTLVRHVFHNLYASYDLDAAISEVLAFVGTYFDVSRVYIFENNSDDTVCYNTFEWCNNGITPQIDNLQGISYQEDVPSWKSSFNESGVLYSADIREMPEDLRATLEPQGIKSVLHCAIMDQGKFRGVVGFDECSASRLWTQGQITLLQFLAEVLSVFLLKRRKNDDTIA